MEGESHGRLQFCHKAQTASSWEQGPNRPSLAPSDGAGPADGFISDFWACQP